MPFKTKKECVKAVHKKCYCHIPDDDVSGGTQCLPVPGSIVDAGKPEPKRLALFHYATKSRQDFDVKMKRGGGNSRGNARQPWFFEAAMECVLFIGIQLGTLRCKYSIFVRTTCWASDRTIKAGVEEHWGSPQARRDCSISNWNNPADRRVL